MSGFDYSKWDKIELSDDEDDLHPNIDKDSWFRLKHRTRVEREEEEAKTRLELEQKLRRVNEDLKVFGVAGQEHLKALKLRQEAADIEEQLATMERQRKWNADNMCKTAESRTEVSESQGPPGGPEPRLKGEALTKGYVEYIEQHEQLLEEYIALGSAELEEVRTFLQEHGGTLLQGEHAESYLLLDCLEKEMNEEHEDMCRSARQSQLLSQLREFSRAAGRPVRDAVYPIFEKLIDHEETSKAFDEAVSDFVRKIEKRAVEKKKEMDAEEEAERKAERKQGPGGLDPIEVFKTLPLEMQAAFQAKDVQRLQAAVDALDEEEAAYHLGRCEDSGLWVPSESGGPPPYRQ